MLVFVAIVMSVLMAFGAVAVDASVLDLQKTRMQNGLDAAVLAGASLLPDTGAATAEANSYLAKNGQDTNGVSYSFSGSNMIITATKTMQVQAGFSKVFGNETSAVSAKAAAQRYSTSLWPYDYLLFCNDPSYTLNMGGRFDIQGSVHANGSIYASPGYGKVTGSLEACSTVYANPSTTSIGALLPGAPHIDMPDFTNVVASIKPKAPTLPAQSGVVKNLGSGSLQWDSSQTFNNYTVTTGNTTINCNDATINNTFYSAGSLNVTGKAVLNNLSTLYVNGNLTIGNQSVLTGDIYVNGDVHISGGSPVCVLNGNIYATGSITFDNNYTGAGSLYAGGDISFSGGAVKHTGTIFAGGRLNMGNSFTGSGNLFANGDITFNGNGMQMNQTQSVCVYSANGNIYMVTGDTTVTGVVYAPKGSANIAGNNTTYIGSVIANRIVGIPANLVAKRPSSPPAVFSGGEYKVKLVK